MLGIFGSSARFAPDHPAFIVPDGPVVSYGALSERVAAFSARLSAGRGLIEIVCDGHLNQYIAYLGALQARCPVILSAAGTEGRQPFFVRYTYVPGRDALDVAPGEETQDLHPDLALLLSTSGSTGAAKAVRLSRANLEANAVSIAEYLALSPADRAPMALPFQYSYGLSVVNSHLAVGATLVLTEGSVSEPAFWAQFRAARCSSLAGVPHTFELMEQAGIDSADLTDLRYMTQAGGKLAAAKVAAWSARAAAEGWSFVVMYGQTEAAPRISYLPPARAAERPGAIGVAIPGGRLSVLDEAGQPVPDGTTGELVYQGPNVMMGYATQASDLALGQGPDVLHTGDLAVRHPDGLFEIVGRASRFVKLFGYRIGLDALETRLAEEGIEAAAHASGDALSVLVATGPEDPEAQRTTARTAIARITSLPPTAATILTTDKLPRTENGKIDTKKVKNIIQNAQESKTGGARLKRALPWRGKPETVQAVFQRAYPDQTLSDDMSFDDLGGDSLTYLAVALDLERLIGALPEDWRTLSISALSALAHDQKPGVMGRIDTPTAIRALAITMIAMGHLKLLNYGGGGASTLFLIAGFTFAALTLPTVLSLGSVVPAVVLAARVVALTFSLGLVKLVVTGFGEWRGFTLVSNWISPNIQGDAWFVEIYVQLLAVLVLVLCFPTVRRSLANHAFAVFITASFVFVAIGALSDQIVDLNHLFRRVPHLYAWILLCGAAVCFARTARDRALVTLAFLAGHFQFEGYYLKPSFFLFAGLVVIWLPYLSLPRVILPVVRNISAASLMIYLTHVQFGTLVRKTLDAGPAVAVLVALTGGVLLWKAYLPVDGLIKDRLTRMLGQRVGDQSARL